MNAVVETPVDLVKSVGNLHLPPKADRRLQGLMDRNNEGRLSQAEREELAELAEWSEKVALMRAEALLVLGRQLE